MALPPFSPGAEEGSMAEPVGSNGYMINQDASYPSVLQIYSTNVPGGADIR